MELQPYQPYQPHQPQPALNPLPPRFRPPRRKPPIGPASPPSSSAVELKARPMIPASPAASPAL